MATRKAKTAPPEKNKFRLLSVNAVSKKLGVGYSRAKSLIESGNIESVNMNGTLRVPEIKLEKFINQPNTFINGNNGHKIKYKDDEDKAQSIIENLNGN
ncbi:MAG: helix-turn-helix domain-containing protein [Ignavibacteria bacterium]